MDVTLGQSEEKTEMWNTYVNTTEGNLKDCK